MSNPCGKCWLKYSSYCVGCKNEWRGMGYQSRVEYIADKEVYEAEKARDARQLLQQLEVCHENDDVRECIELLENLVESIDSDIDIKLAALEEYMDFEDGE